MWCKGANKAAIITLPDENAIAFLSQVRPWTGRANQCVNVVPVVRKQAGGMQRILKFFEDDH
jgi:hypothetical protein